MRIALVQINDFLSIGEAKFRLDDKGLILVQGVNKDNTSAVSNGAGKSSLVDAVMWCLYGETARGESTDKVIRDGAKKAFVGVNLVEDDGTLYTITRERTKGKVALRIFQTDKVKSATEITLGTTALTQNLIVRLLGASAEVFRASVYLGQDALPDLPNMTDKRLKELVEEASGLSAIEACYERARQAHQTKANELVRAEDLLRSAEASLATAKNSAARTEEDVREWDNAHAARVADMVVLLGRAVDEVGIAEKAAALLKPELERATKRNDEIRAELALVTPAQDEARAARTRHTTARIEETRAEAFARSAIADLKRAEERLTHLKAGCTCDECGQDLPAEQIATLTRSAEDAVIMARSAAHTALEQLKVLRQQAAQAHADAEAKEWAVPNVTTLQAELNAFNRTIFDIGQSQGAVVATKAERDRLQASYDALVKENNPCANALSRAIDRVNFAKGEVAAYEASVRALQESVTRARQVVEVFGPSGVRAEILDQVTPYLNARTAAYLDALSDGTLKAVWSTLVRDAKGNLREKFSIEVSHPAGEGFSVLSGGEKRKVRLAAALALQDLVASRATKPVNLFIADEIDDALDEAGLERLMGVLGEKAREKGTVLVISHNSLTDWIPNAWTVTKESGTASLETA